MTGLTGGLRGPARGAIGVAAVIGLVLTVATGRELRLGSQAMADADAAGLRGDFATAIARARDAAEAAAPGSPYPRQGFARLESLARAAEARQDDKRAIAAWGAMRGAATATSAPFVATEEWQARADVGLIRVGAQAQTAPGEVHAREDTLRAALAHDDAPLAGVLLLLGVGAAALLGGLGRLTFAARDLGALRREKVALAATAAGALLYAVACFRA